MWPTVLLIAATINFEPIRIGLLPFLVARERPILQLLAVLAGSVVSSLVTGLLVLFVFHRSPLSTNSSSGGWAQIVIGVLALLIAAMMTARYLKGRRNRVSPQQKSASTAGTNKITGLVVGILRRGRSPWFSALVGLSFGLPNVDYLALLVVIATAGAGPPEQAAALIAFIVVANLNILVPVVSYTVAPAKTLETLERFTNWTRSRSDIEYAAFTFIVGCILVGLGMNNL